MAACYCVFTHLSTMCQSLSRQYYSTRASNSQNHGILTTQSIQHYCLVLRGVVAGCSVMNVFVCNFVPQSKTYKNTLRMDVNYFKGFDVDTKPRLHACAAWWEIQLRLQRLLSDFCWRHDGRVVRRDELDMMLLVSRYVLRILSTGVGERQNSVYCITSCQGDGSWMHYIALVEFMNQYLCFVVQLWCWDVTVWTSAVWLLGNIQRLNKPIIVAHHDQSLFINV